MCALCRYVCVCAHTPVTNSMAKVSSCTDTLISVPVLPLLPVRRVL